MDVSFLVDATLFNLRYTSHQISAANDPDGSCHHGCLEETDGAKKGSGNWVRPGDPSGQ